MLIYHKLSSVHVFFIRYIINSHFHDIFQHDFITFSVVDMMVLSVEATSNNPNAQISYSVMHTNLFKIPNPLVVSV